MPAIFPMTSHVLVNPMHLLGWTVFKVQSYNASKLLSIGVAPGGHSEGVCGKCLISEGLHVPLLCLAGV